MRAHTDNGLDLHAQRGNLYTHIFARTHEPLPDEVLARLADEALTRLDSGAERVGVLDPGRPRPTARRRSRTPRQAAPSNHIHNSARLYGASNSDIGV